MTQRPKEAMLNDHYDNLRYYSPLDHTPFRDICGMVDITPTPPILDVGCGDGRLASRNPDLEIVGVDYNQKRVEEARRRGLTVHHSDLYDFLAAADPYGLIVFVEVLEHLEEPLHALTLARRLGPVIATVPINLPYKAHLSVWPSIFAIQADFDPDRSAQFGRHAVLYWSQYAD